MRFPCVFCNYYVFVCYIDFFLANFIALISSVSFIVVCFIRLDLMLSKITSLILPTLFFVGLISLTVALFWKFSLWSLTMKKQVLSSLISGRSRLLDFTRYWWIDINEKSNCFFAFKNHKVKIQNNPTVRLINLAKNNLKGLAKLLYTKLTRV